MRNDHVPTELEASHTKQLALWDKFVREDLSRLVNFLKAMEDFTTHVITGRDGVLVMFLAPVSLSLPKHGVIHLRWREKLLKQPFYVAQSSKGTAKIEIATAFSRRHAQPPTFHDWRAKGLHPINQCYYSQDQMIRLGRYHDKGTFRENYLLRIARVDGELENAPEKKDMECELVALNLDTGKDGKSHKERE